ncbi:MAG: ATP-binding protein [Thermodesulfobacteriota bacterium]
MRDDAGIDSDRIRSLSEAFSSFTAASGLLERAYGELQEKVRYLTVELEERNAQLRERNAQLKAALADAESAKDGMRELEAQAERNRRLIRMGEMAAKIVHEIRSPLCSIELYATMLESELGDGEASRLSRGISSGILGVNNILTNMLLFARQRKPAMIRANPAAVVGEALCLLEPMVGPRGILLERDAGEAPPLDGDPELLKQALLNIALNAVQATPGGGRVRVAVRNEGGGAVIAVSDEGEGIPEENLERIFDPFFSTKAKGTGLGLAIASRIMEAHGGFIRVRSAPGRGSAFELHFPPAGTRKEAAV